MKVLSSVAGYPIQTGSSYCKFPNSPMKNQIPLELAVRRKGIVCGFTSMATVLLALACPQLAFAGPPPGTGPWTQTFNEDFSGTALNPALWNTGPQWTAIINNELQAYRPENVTVANGFCTIKAEKRSSPPKMYCSNGYEFPTQYPYASGMIQTYDKWTQKYGYFEARIKMSSGKGTWPAFWLMPDRGNAWGYLDQTRTRLKDVGYGRGVEIDVMEYMSSWKNPSTGKAKAHSGYIWQYAVPAEGIPGGGWRQYTMTDPNPLPPLTQHPGDRLNSPDTEFHTYGVYWGPDTLIFYVDGHAVLGTIDAARMSNVQQYMILNLAIHQDDWQNGPNFTLAEIDATLPTTMMIDWVRAYSGTAVPYTSIEAEAVSGVTSSDAISNVSESTASGGVMELMASNAVNDYVIYPLNVPVAGSYDIYAWGKRAASRGKFQLSISGTNYGQEQDQYVATTPDYAMYYVGTAAFATSGTKPLKFTVTGKNAASSGYGLAFDRFRLYPHNPEAPAGPVKHEVELLTVATFSDPVSQIYEAPASGGLYHILSANATNDEITYVVPVTAPGTYNIAVYVKKVNTRGIFQLSVDGVNVGAPQDLYAPTASFTVLNLGSVYFATGGAKAFKFTVTGKNASSSGYTLALDAIQLQ